MKLLGRELTFNNNEIWHKGNFDPASKVDKAEFDNLEIGGRNLIQRSWLKNNSDIDYNTGLERSSGSRTIVTEFIQVTPQQTYMLQRPVDQGNVGARYYDSDKNHIGSASLGSGRVFKLNIPDGCYYFKFIDEANTLDEGYKFEKGNKATDWTPAPEDIQAELDKKADKTDIPTKVGQLENDKNYVTQEELESADYGNMVKSVYDKDDDGIVDVAETVIGNEIQLGSYKLVYNSTTNSLDIEVIA
jgi:hypothetical protein